MGVAADTRLLYQFLLELLGVNVTWSWSYLAYAAAGLLLFNIVMFFIISSIFVWFFNTASALSGGILVRFEVLEDPQ